MQKEKSNAFLEDFMFAISLAVFWIGLVCFIGRTISSSKPQRIMMQEETSRTERSRVYMVERGAEDDVADLALSEHQELNYARCFLRAGGFLTCQVHTPPADVEATCRARQSNEFLVDKTRCRWSNPERMAHQ
jgi:hypothetical protein